MVVFPFAAAKVCLCDPAAEIENNSRQEQDRYVEASLLHGDHRLQTGGGANSPHLGLDFVNKDNAQFCPSLPPGPGCSEESQLRKICLLLKFSFASASVDFRYLDDTSYHCTGGLAHLQNICLHSIPVI